MKKIIIILGLISILILSGCGIATTESYVCTAQCRNAYFHNISDSCYMAFNTDEALRCGLTKQDSLNSKLFCLDICGTQSQTE